MIKIQAMDKETLSSERPPSPKQWQAISITGSDVLVAAAAGSGKTEVLSERIARNIADKGWDIDQILVLTFTRAAAKEMLDRIESKMVSKLTKHNTPEADQHLKNQRLLMGSALVTTIDAFCLRVLEKFYYLVEEEVRGKKRYLAPGFKVLIDNSRFLGDSMNQVIQDTYHKNPRGLDILFQVYSRKEEIEKSIINLYRKILSIPNYKNYIVTELFENIKIDTYDKILNKMEDIRKDNYLEVIDNIEKELKTLKNKKEKDTVINSLKISDLRKEFLLNEDSKIGFDESLDNKAVLKEGIDKILERSEESYYNLIGIKDYLQAKNNLAIFIKTIREMLINLDDEFIYRKRKASYLDFADLNHLAINVLEKWEDGQRKDTEASLYYKNLFREIYVDEYQDNNDLQEYILNLVRKEGTYFFRVGDVKQSIYGFRGSNAELFEEKYNTFENIDNLVSDEEYDLSKEYEFNKEVKGVCVALSENFRSYSNVLETSNFIFNRLMKNNRAGISYDRTSALYYPQVKIEKNVPDEKIATKLIVNTIKEKWNVETLAEKIAWEIKELSKEKLNFSDFAILLRSAQSMQIYKDALAKLNIPVYFKEKAGFAKSHAFSILFNLLKFLDNRTKDVSLLVLLKTIFDFTNNELYDLSKKEGDTLYEKLENYKNSKAQNATNLLKKWFTYSYNHTSYQLVNQVAKDINLFEYLKALDLEDSEIDYYENFLDIVQIASNDDANLSHTLKVLNSINKEQVYESKRRSPENSVTIATIHYSKGLEYKYVFLTDLDSKFNESDSTSKIIFSRELGLSVDQNNFYLDSLNKNYRLNAELIRKKSIEEEIRNLYVAFTRAKNALYVCSVNNLSLDEVKDNKDTSLLGILQNAFSKYSEADKEENEQNALIEYLDIDVLRENEANTPNSTLARTDTNRKITELENVEADININTLPIKEILYPIKTSYSALKKINEETEKEEKEIEYLDYKTHKKTKLKDAIFKGNLVHKLFEKMVKDIKSGIEIKNIEEYLLSIKKGSDSLINIKEARILSQEEYVFLSNAKEIKNIEKFLKSKLIEIIKKSDKIETEISFTSPKKAKDIFIDTQDEDTLILQGVIDLLIKTKEGKYILVDYKTDNVKIREAKEILSRRHKEQLEIYAQAIKDYYGKEIEIEKYIYSYIFGDIISCN